MSAIFAPDAEHTQSVNATKLRDLDAFEEFFWLVEQSVTVFHVVVVEVSGATTIEQWKSALDAIQVRYPLLSASIRKVPGKRTFFEKVQGVSMPLRTAPLRNSLVLEDGWKRASAIFWGWKRSTYAATLFHAPDRSVVMFATHHSSLDGKSHLLLVQDLLAFVTGEDPGGRLWCRPGWGSYLRYRTLQSMQRSWKDGPLRRKMVRR
jgi:hypothetical protein